jgi:hypothetical protein
VDVDVVVIVNVVVGGDSDGDGNDSTLSLTWSRGRCRSAIRQRRPLTSASMFNVAVAVADHSNDYAHDDVNVDVFRVRTAP